MFKYILQSVENMDLMAIGPMLLFVIFFILVSIYAVRKDKSYIDKMGHLPLEENQNETN